jgi:hypothetical protein
LIEPNTATSPATDASTRSRLLDTDTAAERLDVHAVDARWTPNAVEGATLATKRAAKQEGTRSPLTDSNLWWGKVGGGAGWTIVDVQAQARFACNSPWWFDWHDALMQRMRYYGNGWYETIAYE